MASDSVDKEVIVKLTIEESRFLKQVREAKEGIDGLDKRTTKYKDAVRKLTEAQTRLAVVRKKISVQRKLEIKEIENLTKVTKQAKDATGGTTSAALELGRVVQDAPYGIRGMANNITQLVSSMAFATKQAGSFSLALKQLWKTLMGPLGLVFAISGVVALLDHFYGGMKKSESATADLTKELSDQVKALNSHKEVLDLANLSLEERLGLIKAVSATDKEFKKLLKETNGTYEDSQKALEDYIYSKNQELQVKEKVARFDEIQKKLAEAGLLTLKQANNELLRIEDERIRVLNSVSSLEERSAKNLIYDKRKKEVLDLISLQEERHNLLIDINGLIDKEKKAAIGSERDLNNRLTFLKKERAEVKLNSEAYQEYTLHIKAIEKLLAKPKKKGQNKTKEDKLLPDPKDVIIKVDSLTKIIAKYDRDTKLAEATTNREKLIIRKEFALKELQIRAEADEEAIKLKRQNNVIELSLFLKQQKAKGLMTKAEADERLKLYNTETQALLRASKDRYSSAITSLSNFYDILFKKDEEAVNKENEKGESGKEDVWTARAKKIKKYADLAKAILGSLNDFIQAELDRELVTEQNRTTAANNELNQRLLNENLSKDQRKAIQNEIARNDEELRKKQEVIEKKKFEANKKAKVAEALVNTYSAVAGVMADAKGGFFARLAQAIPTLAFGLAQVAAIARQKFQTSSSSVSRGAIQSASSSDAGSGDRDFNFNLVGNNPDNQLATLIQSKFDTPLKAYVVSKDVTTQQQLDANIKSTATV